MNEIVNMREQARTRAARAQTQELLEENKKKVPVIQAKSRLKAAQTKMKSATATIKVALNEFNGLKDAAPSDKEVAAHQINSCWKRLVSGEDDLQKVTDILAEVLGNADPTIIEGDVMQQIKQNEAEKERLLEEWTTFRHANFNEIQSVPGNSLHFLKMLSF